MDGGTSSSSSSGGSSSSSSSSGGTPTTSQLGKKEGGFRVDNKERDQVLEAITGTHDVAVYLTPNDKTAWIGLGKITVSRTGNVVTLKLTGGDGSTAQEVTHDMDNVPVGGNASVSGGRLRFSGGNDQAIDVNFSETGEIAGLGGRLTDIGFRNNILAYGPPVPSQLSGLAGTWKGDHSAGVCKAPVEATFAAEKITVKGTPQPGCKAEETWSTAWRGNGDYVIPTSVVDPNPRIFIYSTSVDSSGTRIDLNADGTIKDLTVFFTGFAGGVPKGDINSINLKKQ